MNKQVAELEAILQLQIAEHRTLLALCEAHHAAMKKFDLPAIENATRQQETSRLRIGGLEARRRAMSLQIMKAMKLTAEPKLLQLAELVPTHRSSLLKLRTELRSLMTQISNKNFIGSRLANAVLGHLNTAVRLLAGAVEKAGLYTKQGLPKVAARIGVMEAVG